MIERQLLPLHSPDSVPGSAKFYFLGSASDQGSVGKMRLIAIVCWC